MAALGRSAKSRLASVMLTRLLSWMPAWPTMRGTMSRPTSCVPGSLRPRPGRTARWKTASPGSITTTCKSAPTVTPHAASATAW